MPLGAAKFRLIWRSAKAPTKKKEVLVGDKVNIPFYLLED